jgi:hypothetical protein
MGRGGPNGGRPRAPLPPSVTEASPQIPFVVVASITLALIVILRLILRKPKPEHQNQQLRSSDGDDFSPELAERPIRADSESSADNEPVSAVSESFARETSARLSRASESSIAESGGLVTALCGIRATSLEYVAGAHHAWSPIDWSTIRLRVGPDYRRHKRKAPTAQPLLPCVGVEVLNTPEKVFSDGIADARCLPPEVAAAAAEATPPVFDAKSSEPPPPLPRYLSVSISMPQYQGSAADGETVRVSVLHAVPQNLRKDPSAAAKLLCEFLDGCGTGHKDPKGLSMAHLPHYPPRPCASLMAYKLWSTWPREARPLAG